MAKLGYTWYPKDWGNSENVFELNLSERGLYREFIDLSMLNDNKIEIKKSFWARKFCASIEDIDSILDKLISLKLVTIIDNFLFVPSCENRLNLIRGGSNGGKKSKPIVKPIVKPFESLEQKKEKPIPNQIESKVNEIEIKDNLNAIYKSFLHLSLSKKEFLEINKEYSKGQIDFALLGIENTKNVKSYTSLDYAVRFWLKDRPKENIKSKKPPLL